MRILLAATLAALAIPAGPTIAAGAPTSVRAEAMAGTYTQQDWRDRDRRNARQDQRQTRRDWRRYRNYDYNRLPPGQRGYYADQYYRDGRYYRERRLTRNDRIYRGNDGRYYCRRSDGTTGLIVGGVAGGLFGNAISNGGNSTLGTLLGAAAGAAIGQSVDRGNVRCR